MMLIVEFVVLLSRSRTFPADVGLCCYGEGSAASARMLHHVCMEQGDAERDASSFSDWLLSLQFSLSWLTPAHRCSNGWPAVTWQFDDPVGCACLQEWECVSLFFAPISFDCCQFLRCCNEIDATYLGTRRTQRIACCTCFLMLAFSKCSRAKIKLCLFHVVFHI